MEKLVRKMDRIVNAEKYRQILIHIPYRKRTVLKGIKGIRTEVTHKYY